MIDTPDQARPHSKLLKPWREYFVSLACSPPLFAKRWFSFARNLFEFAKSASLISTASPYQRRPFKPPFKPPCKKVQNNAALGAFSEPLATLGATLTAGEGPGRHLHSSILGMQSAGPCCRFGIRKRCSDSPDPCRLPCSFGPIVGVAVVMRKFVRPSHSTCE